jgi:MFS family permease
MRKLFYLFATNLVILIVGYGVFPLLPGYAMRFGADTGAIGLFLGIVYIAISLGSMLPGWLPAHMSRKKLFIAGSLVGLPGLFLLGQASALWQVVLLTALIWFSGGVGLALGSVYTGLLSAEGKRGRAFTLVSLSTPVATLAGGLVVGRLVQWQGYAFAFTALGVMWLALPLIVFFKLDDVRAGAAQDATGTEAVTVPGANTAFTFLMVAALLVAGAISIGRMGSSVAMEALTFSPAAISGTTAVAGVALIPFMLLSGGLADRLGAQRFLVGGYLLAGAGAVTLMAATQLWQFGLAMTLLLLGRAASDSLAPAVATDLLPQAAIHRALPRLKATNWMAGVASFIGGGYAMELLGTRLVFAGAAAVALLAASLLFLSRRQRPRPASRPQPAVAVAVPASVPCGD